MEHNNKSSEQDTAAQQHDAPLQPAAFAAAKQLPEQSSPTPAEPAADMPCFEPVPNAMPASEKAQQQAAQASTDQPSAAPQTESSSQATAAEEQLPSESSGGQPPVPPSVPPTAAASPEEEEKPMGLLDHLNELRWRLMRCLLAATVGFMLCWAVVEPLFDILTFPLMQALPAGDHAQYTTMPEAFFTRMVVAFVAGLFLASPFIFYQIWAFISPGLYDEEKRYIVPIAFISAIFFIGGGLFCYFIVFPYAFDFFMGFSTERMKITPRVSDYLEFILKLLVAFGLIFEMPLFSFFLARMGVLTAALMRKVRRYAILVIFIVAAILTPPDVVSQLLMACPMLILYEISILVAVIFAKKKKPEPEESSEKTSDQEA